VLGKLDPGTKLPLDIAIRDLKQYSRELPSNLYSLSSRHVRYIERMISIIKGMDVPEKMTNE